MTKVQELLKDKTVAKKIMGAASPKEAFEILEQYDLDMDYNTFLNTVETLKNMYEKQNAGLLSEEDMDNMFDTLNSEQMVGSTFFFLLSPGGM